MKWNVASFSLKPDTDNVHCLLAAKQWMLKNNLPFVSAIDTAKLKVTEVRINARVAKQEKKSSRSR